MSIGITSVLKNNNNNNQLYFTHQKKKTNFTYLKKVSSQLFKIENATIELEKKISVSRRRCTKISQKVKFQKYSNEKFHWQPKNFSLFFVCARFI